MTSPDAKQHSELQQEVDDILKSVQSDGSSKAEDRVNAGK